MSNPAHKIMLVFFSVLPIAFALLVLWVTLYQDGYYIEATVEFGQGFKVPNGEFSFDISGILPDDYELRMEGDEIMLWGPPPEGTKVHLEYTEYYKIARQVKLSTDYLFGPFFYPKLFIESLGDNLVYFGIAIAIGETIFNGLSRKYEKNTVFHIYKIDIIKIKILSYTHLEKA